jgi:hypothetical protein
VPPGIGIRILLSVLYYHVKIQQKTALYTRGHHISQAIEDMRSVGRLMPAKTAIDTEEQMSSCHFDASDHPVGHCRQNYRRKLEKIRGREGHSD